jgi:hypothetical protein
MTLGDTLSISCEVIFASGSTSEKASISVSATNSITTDPIMVHLQKQVSETGAWVTTDAIGSQEDVKYRLALSVLDMQNSTVVTQADTPTCSWLITPSKTENVSCFKIGDIIYVEFPTNIGSQWRTINAISENGPPSYVVRVDNLVLANQNKYTYFYALPFKDTNLLSDSSIYTGPTVLYYDLMGKCVNNLAARSA